MALVTPLERTVLTTLLDGQEWYGRQLYTTVEGISRGGLYPALQRLEQRGWLALRLEEKRGRQGRPRRYYRITPMGRGALQRTRIDVAFAHSGLSWSQLVRRLGAEAPAFRGAMLGGEPVTARIVEVGAQIFGCSPCWLRGCDVAQPVEAESFAGRLPPDELDELMQLLQMRLYCPSCLQKEQDRA